MRLGIRQKVRGGICVLAILGCCLPLVAGAVSSGTDRVRIRAVPPDEATRFVRGEHWTIFLDGPIDAGAADRLSEIIAAEGIDAASVYLNSRGGSLAAGVAIGRVIRASGFSTNVGRETTDPLETAPGVCFSACAFAYAGGGWRYLDVSQIGVHRFHGEAPRGDVLATGQSVSGLITHYLSEMGISTDLFALMAQVPERRHLRSAGRGGANVAAGQRRS